MTTIIFILVHEFLQYFIPVLAQYSILKKSSQIREAVIETESKMEK